MLIPLWQSTNHTANSLAFTLCANEVALFVAMGFESSRTKTTASEMRSPQKACLHRIIVEYNPEQPTALEPCNSCEFMYEYHPTKSTVYDEPVRVNGCVFSLSKCNNTMLLALPGTYYFHLNDTTAIGQVQIWVEIYKVDELPLALLGDYLGGCHG